MACVTMDDLFSDTEKYEYIPERKDGEKRKRCFLPAEMIVAVPEVWYAVVADKANRHIPYGSF